MWIAAKNGSTWIGMDTRIGALKDENTHKATDIHEMGACIATYKHCRIIIYVYTHGI